MLSKLCITLALLSALMSGGCAASDVRVAATQQSPSPMASPVNRVTAVQNWVARHQEEDRSWVARTGLTPEQVHKLRLMADVPDDEAASVVNLDTENLRTRDQVLLVTASGNGHCLELVVFNREGDDFRRNWSVAEMPSGAGFCRDSPVDPEAYATNDGKLIVKIPAFDYNKGVSKAAKLYTYEWNGKTYEFVGTRRSDVEEH